MLMERNELLLLTYSVYNTIYAKKSIVFGLDKKKKRKKKEHGSTSLDLYTFSKRVIFSKHPMNCMQLSPLISKLPPTNLNYGVFKVDGTTHTLCSLHPKLVGSSSPKVS